MHETCQKVKFPTVQERGISREFVLFFTAVFCSWGSWRPFLMVQEPPLQQSSRGPALQHPQPSPCRSKCGSQSKPQTKTLLPPRTAVRASALMSHSVSQLDAEAQLDPLQLGHLPAWALKSCAGCCLPLPRPAFGFDGFGDVPPPRCSLSAGRTRLLFPWLV